MVLLAAILIITIAIQIFSALVAAEFIDQATSDGSMKQLMYLAVITLALSIAGKIVAVAETYVAEYVGWEATNALRIDMASHLLGLDARFHAAHSVGSLIERVDGDVSTLSRFFSRFIVNVIGNALLLAGVLYFLFNLEWRIGLGLTTFVLIALIVMMRIRAKATPYWAADRQASADFYGTLGEHLTGLEDIQTSGAANVVLHHNTRVTRLWLAATQRAQMMGYAMVASSQGLFALGLAFSLGLSAIMFREGLLTLGGVYLIFRFTEMLREPTEHIRNEVQDFQQADASMGRILELLQTTPGLVDGPGVALPTGPLSVGLDRVTFGYTEDRPVLRDVSVNIAPGRVLGVVGRTGSGKTTLTRLLPRFYDPQQGTVTIGDTDLRSVQRSAIRSRIGLVTQDVNVFNASIRDNVTLFDNNVSD